jgi:SAM-dependent methyltransferase
MSISNTIYHRSQHLKESDLVPADLDTDSCRLCGGGDLVDVWTLQETPSISLRECPHCHAVGASRTPTSEALTSYYSAYYQSEGSDAKYTFGSPNRLAVRIARQFQTVPAEDITILDFGGGDGTIAYLVAMEFLRRGSRSASITVVDYEDRTIVSQTERIKIRRELDLDRVPDEPFTVVIASAVIEHHPRPREIFLKLLKLVATDGLFYARTPYMLPLMKALNRIGLRLDFTFPAHLYDLGEDFWTKIFQLLAPDFKVVVSRPSMVETSFSQSFFRAFLAHALKLPWYVLGRTYGFVGGWEVFAFKQGAAERHRP